ncbi:MAG: HRDC domain-containing protein [Candidatus Cloacimonetes bacterium]|nr:HRDC domain-containing protein [Candidatus Cloacimonadota bacterium]
MFFSIAISRSFDDSEFVKFCEENQIIHIDKEFFHSGDGVYYSFFIEYVSKKKSDSNPLKDLSEEQIVQYNRLRDWRNELAANEGLPAYIILYNSQIAEIVKCQQLHSFQS